MDVSTLSITLLLRARSLTRFCLSFQANVHAVHSPPVAIMVSQRPLQHLPRSTSVEAEGQSRRMILHLLHADTRTRTRLCLLQAPMRHVPLINGTGTTYSHRTSLHMRNFHDSSDPTITAARICIRVGEARPPRSSSAIHYATSGARTSDRSCHCPSILYRGADCTPSYPSYSTIPPFPILHDPSDHRASYCTYPSSRPHVPPRIERAGKRSILSLSTYLQHPYASLSSFGVQIRTCFLSLFFAFALCILHPSFIGFLFYYLLFSTTIYFSVDAFDVRCSCNGYGSWLRIWSWLRTSDNYFV